MTALDTRLTAESALVHQIETLVPETPWEPAHELIATEREVRLAVDLPGVLPKNLHVVCHAGRLHVYGHRNATHLPRALEHTSTRRFGDFALAVAIPEWVDGSRAFQAFDAGILTVVFPRRRESQPSAHGPL